MADFLTDVEPSRMPPLATLKPVVCSSGLRLGMILPRGYLLLSALLLLVCCCWSKSSSSPRDE